MPKGSPQKDGYAALGAFDEELEDDEASYWQGRHGCLKRVTYSWLTPLFRLGNRRQINLDDLPGLESGWLYWQQLHLGPMVDETKAVLAEQAEAGGGGIRGSLMWALCRVFWRDFLRAFSCDTLVQICNLTNPVLMRAFISFMATPDAPMSEGLALALALFLLVVLRQPIENFSFLIGGNLGAKQRSVVNALIFQKSLKLSNEARQSSSVGQIVNLMSNDANRFQQFAWFAINAWMIPVYLTIAMVMLVRMLGLAALSGILVLVCSLFLNGRMMIRLRALRTTQLKQTDDRVKQTNEAVLGIRVVKLYTWEQSIEDRIADLRTVELERIRTAERLMALNRFMFFSIPVVTAVITFLTFTMLGNKMDPALIFSSMALFNLIQEYLSTLPNAVSTITQVRVAQNRINKFLKSAELETPADDIRTELPATDGLGEVVLKGVSVQWEKAAERPSLSGLNLSARGGQLIGVVGAVGSGKSTLLAAMLGEMYQTSGRVISRGSVGYCGQEPWLISGTLKDNVIYGSPLDQARYESAIAACGLEPDLKQLPDGDQTTIGERGINISGGQKQRIALARAVYRQAHLYLLDDVLAAVDVHVGEHLMAKCICGEMAGSTRVLVTNALHFLPRCDYIYVLKDETIAEEGTYHELIHSDSLLVEMGAVETPTTPNAAADDTDSSDESLVVVSTDRKGAALKSMVSKPPEQLVKAEDRKYGKVELATYTRYIRSGATELTTCAFLVSGFLAPEWLSVASQLWLSRWSNQSVGATQSSADILYYQAIYAALALGAMVILLCRAWVWAGVVVKAARRIHEQLLSAVLRLPVAYFDRTYSAKYFS